MNTTSTKNSATNIFTTIAQNAQEATTTFADQVNSLATNLAKSANMAVNAGVNGLNAGLNAINSAATTTVNAAAPVVNSMLPLNMGANTNRANNKNVAMNNSFSNIVNSTNTAVNNAVNAALNLNKNKGAGFPAWFWVAVVFVIIASVITGLMVFYKEQVSRAFANIGSWFKGGEKAPPAPSAEPEPAPEPGAPQAAGEPSILEKGAAVLGKILPSKKEVFNINANDFTYYDAEPMCRALGAELATYDQVKEAWSKGANWCNYGWAKGQVAVYPTQKEFYEKLQSGPPEDQNACGTPGVNGGFFDNPEMRFGVNCYGVKPSQTANDVRLLEEKGVLPQSPDTLKVNQQAQEFKEKLGSIGVMPFSDNQWSEY